MRLCYLLTLCSLLPQPLRAQEDAGAEDAASACGDLTFQGECVGVRLQYCDRDGRIRVVDCLSWGGSCGLVDCDAPDCLGYSCVAAEGESCRALYCDVHLGHGCLGGVCALSERCDSESFVPYCDAALLLFCPTGRVWDQDCSEGGSYPAVCGVSSSGENACLRTEGAQCDLLQGIECAPEFSCSGGFCVRAAAADGGEAGDVAMAGDAGDSAQRRGGSAGWGCSASETGGAAPVWLSAALCTWLLGGRRRRLQASARRGADTSCAPPQGMPSRGS